MDSFRLRNYRCLDDTGNIELKPINFFLGANSSGKSSVLKFLPLIRQSMYLKRNGTFLWYGEDVDFNYYKNVVKDGEGNINVSFTLKNFRVPFRGLKKCENSTDLTVSLTLESDDGKFDYLQRIIITYLDQSIEIEHNSRRGASYIRANGQQFLDGFDRLLNIETNSLLPKFLFVQKDQADDEYPIWTRKKFLELSSENFSSYRKVLRSLFFGTKADTADYVINQLSIGDSKLEVNRQFINNIYLLHHINTIIDGINIYFLQLSKSISYVGPLRASAQRYYRFQNYNVEKIDADGKNLPMYLNNLETDALIEYNNWIYSLFNFNVALNPNDGNVEILIKEKGKENRNMVDVGFGYSQILPIITMVWEAVQKLSEDNTANGHMHVPQLIAIEQPELHLHPRMQSLFAQMLVKVINDADEKNLDIRFVIETHSETIINKIGEDIAMGMCSKDHVNVYLFNAKNEGMEKYVEESTFSEDGQLMNWPYGFFSDYDYLY